MQLFNRKNLYDFFELEIKKLEKFNGGMVVYFISKEKNLGPSWLGINFVTYVGLSKKEILRKIEGKVINVGEEAVIIETKNTNLEVPLKVISQGKLIL